MDGGHGYARFPSQGGANTVVRSINVMAVVLGAISTNGRHILAAARAGFCPAEVSRPELRMHLRSWVDPNGTMRAPWPNIYSVA